MAQHATVQICHVGEAGKLEGFVAMGVQRVWVERERERVCNVWTPGFNEVNSGMSGPVVFEMVGGKNQAS